MYSALHIMQWFSQVLDVFTPKIKRKFFDFYILWIKTNVAYTRLEMIARSIALQLQRQTDLILCTINCFLQWDHLPNMAVSDLAFYYTLYLCFSQLWIRPKKKYVMFVQTWLTICNKYWVGRSIFFFFCFENAVIEHSKWKVKVHKLAPSSKICWSDGWKNSKYILHDQFKDVLHPLWQLILITTLILLKNKSKIVKKKKKVHSLFTIRGSVAFGRTQHFFLGLISTWESGLTQVTF